MKKPHLTLFLNWRLVSPFTSFFRLTVIIESNLFNHKTEVINNSFLGIGVCIYISKSLLSSWFIITPIPDLFKFQLRFRKWLNNPRRSSLTLILALVSERKILIYLRKIPIFWVGICQDLSGFSFSLNSALGLRWVFHFL